MERVPINKVTIPENTNTHIKMTVGFNYVSNDKLGALLVQQHSACTNAHASVTAAVFRKPILRKDQCTNLDTPPVGATMMPDSSSALHMPTITRSTMRTHCSTPLVLAIIDAP
jgi:hypothetical protein